MLRAERNDDPSVAHEVPLAIAGCGRALVRFASKDGCWARAAALCHQAAAWRPWCTDVTNRHAPDDMGLKRADLSDRAQRRKLNTDAASIGLVLNEKGRDQPAWLGPEGNRRRTGRLLGAAGTTPRCPAIARRDSYARFCPGPLSG